MTERTVDRAFPGATALTVLDVYDWIAPDGLRGGSAHVHLASTEAYMVLAGHGRLQTLGTRGYAEADLSPRRCGWWRAGAGMAGAVAGGSARGRGGDRAPARPPRRRGRGTPG